MGKDYHSVKRFAVGVGIFIVLIWCASLCCGAAYVRASSPWAWSIGLSDGVIYCGFYFNSSGWMRGIEGWSVCSPGERRSYGFRLPRVRPFNLIIPMWVLLLIVAESTIFYYWRCRPPSADGLCDACGYDLRGNTSGICPECGGPIADEVRQGTVAQSSDGANAEA